MKRLISTLLLASLIAACSKTENPSNYSFKLTKNIVTSTMEKNDHNDTYRSCNRNIEIAWEVKTSPEDFTGVIFFRADRDINGYTHKNSGHSYAIEIVDGKMLPYSDAHYASAFQDTGDFEPTCNWDKPEQYKLLIDEDTIIMIPGVRPSQKAK